MDGPEISLSSPVKPTYGLFGLSKPRDLGAYKLPVQESSLPSQTDTRMSFIRELASLQSALGPSALAIKESPKKNAKGTSFLRLFCFKFFIFITFLHFLHINCKNLLRYWKLAKSTLKWPKMTDHSGQIYLYIRLASPTDVSFE